MDPLSGPYYCVVIHKFVRKEDQILRNFVGMVRYEWDDGYLLGKKKKVFQALKEFSRQVQMRSGLVLQASKSVVYTLLTYLIYIPEATGLIQAEVKMANSILVSSAMACS